MNIDRVVPRGAAFVSEELKYAMKHRCFSKLLVTNLIMQEAAGSLIVHEIKIPDHQKGALVFLGDHNTIDANGLAGKMIVQ